MVDFIKTKWNSKLSVAYPFLGSMAWKEDAFQYTLGQLGIMCLFLVSPDSLGF